MAGHNHITEALFNGSVAPGASQQIIIDTQASQYCTPMIKCSWDATATTTGISVSQAYGAYLNGEGSGLTQDILMDQHADPVPNIPQPTAGQTSPQTIKWSWVLPLQDCPRYVELTVINEDTANPMTLVAVNDRH